MKFPKETLKKIMDIQIDEENNTLSFLLPKQITYGYTLRKIVIKKCEKQHEFLTVCNVCRNTGEYEEYELTTVKYVCNILDVDIVYERPKHSDGEVKNFRDIYLTVEVKDQLKTNVPFNINKPVDEKALAEEVVYSYDVYDERITVELNNETYMMHTATKREYKMDCICGGKHKGTGKVCMICDNVDLTYKKFVASKKQLIPEYKFYREFDFDTFTFKDVGTAFFTTSKGLGLYRNILRNKTDDKLWSSYASLSKEDLNPLFSDYDKEKPFRKNITFYIKDSGTVKYDAWDNLYVCEDKYNLTYEIFIKDKQQIINTIKNKINYIIYKIQKNINECEENYILASESCDVEIKIDEKLLKNIKILYKDIYACKGEEDKINTLVENIVNGIIGI